MHPRQPSELLYDSEAALRLVDSAIAEMAAQDRESAEVPVGQALRQVPSPGPSTALGDPDLSDRLARGYAEIVAVLSSVRQSRHLLEQSAVDRLQRSHDKLREVSSATETAATDILDGLERATALVNDLDARATERTDGDARAASIRGSLRDELFALVGHMQFHDITSQQLTYASVVLTEMEERLTHVVRIFHPAGATSRAGVAPIPTSPETSATFDPNASTQNREQRQAVADALIAASRGAG